MAYPISKSDLLSKFRDDDAIIFRGKELRDKGYRLIHHAYWSDSVELPCGEQLSKVQIIVRYDSFKDKQTLDEAYEYLILCQEKLCNISGLKFPLS
jgi:hypothetical protein